MLLWTNGRVTEWLRLVDLAEYAPNLRGSGVHGALLVSAHTIFDFICFNPLRPNNDVSQTSHCNIKGLSVSQVMRIENMVTKFNSIDILTASPHYFCKK